MKEIKTYTFMDLLEDEDFISFVHHPGKEDPAYWNGLVEKGKIDPDEYELATYYITKLSEANESLKQEDIKDMWLNIKIENKKNSHSRNHTLILLFATVAAGILFAGIFLSRLLDIPDHLPENTSAKKTNIEDVARPDQASDDIQVILSGNNPISVKEDHSEIRYNDKGEAEINAQKITKPAGQTATLPATYNQLIVPQGKFSSLILSDGTKLWLNAASRVVYPPVFEGPIREIYLEGEAYMEVAADTNRPFLVKTKQMDVKVTGTSFNISAYEEEQSQTVVLVSGRVTVQTKNERETIETTLSPNQLFCISGKKTAIETVNVNHYISWKEGYYIYKSETLSHILNRLSNYYRAEIRYDDDAGNIRYSGKMDLKEDIERVLGGLSHTAPIRYRKESDIHYIRFNRKKESPME